ncbi:MAG: hypothetical protein NXI04_24125 [Planctomycetaceae bacterium]|nr:hypothetical protein [Planctomycetaceae bacterium]
MSNLIAAFQLVVCHTAVADPDVSLVRACVCDGRAQVFAAGRTRVDLASALVDGLGDCDIIAGDITVGPWLTLPERNSPPAGKLVITVCVSGSFEGNDKTAYIGVTPKAPFKVVAAVAKRLRACGMTDVRLLSDKTVKSLLPPPAGAHQADVDTALQKTSVLQRVAR